MSKKLPTGITSRQHKTDGKVTTQYRGRIQDPSRRTPAGAFATKSSRYFDRMSEAKDWLEEHRQLLRKFGTLSVDRTLSVGAACEDWLEVSRVTGINGRRPIEDATHQRYKSTYDNVIVGTMELVKVSELRTPMISKWVGQIAKDKSRDAAHRALSMLKMVLDKQVLDEVVGFNAASPVNISKRGGDDEDDDKIVTEFMSKADVASMLKAADDLCAGTAVIEKKRGMGEHQAAARVMAWARWRPLVYVLLLTGIRIGEACALQWKSVDLAEGVIHVCQTRKRNGSIGAPKTRAGFRHITIGPDLVAMLAEWKASRKTSDDHFVFGDGASVLHPENFATRAWEPMMVLAGLVDAEGNPLWSRHDCRHFHASFLIMSGSSDVQVAERLGHADTTVTRKVYLHLFKELSGAANRIGADLEHLILGRPSAIDSASRATNR